MNLQGDFDGSFLGNIMQLLCDDQRTGILRVKSENRESRVVFKEGTIVYAIGSHKEARLGAILRRDGVLSEKQLKKCLMTAKETKLALGKVLVERGYISLETLKKYNKKQVEEILYNLLFWHKGKFEYNDTEINLGGMIVTQLNPMRLILEASRRIDEMSLFTELIPSDEIIFKISGKPQSEEEEIKFSPNEWRILSLIDGARTIRQLIEISGYDDFAVYKILYSIMSYGLIEKVDETSDGELELDSDRAAIVSYYGGIFQVIEKLLSVEHGHLAPMLFAECKINLSTPYDKIVSAFQIGAIPSDEQIKPIFASLSEVLADKTQQNFLLIDSFNALCRFLLAEITLLGKNPAAQIIKEIELLTEILDEYALVPAEKIKISAELRQICQEVKLKLEKL